MCRNENCLLSKPVNNNKVSQISNSLVVILELSGVLEVQYKKIMIYKRVTVHVQAVAIT